MHKIKMKRILIHTSLILLLFVIGFVTSKGFIELSISLLELNDIDILASSLKSQFNQSIFFRLTLGIIPLIQLLINKNNRNVSEPKNKYFISIGIIVLAGLISW